MENESSDDSLSQYFVSSYKTEIKGDILLISLSFNILGSSKMAINYSQEFKNIQEQECGHTASEQIFR